MDVLKAVGSMARLGPWHISPLLGEQTMSCGVQMQRMANLRITHLNDLTRAPRIAL